MGTKHCNRIALFCVLVLLTSNAYSFPLSTKGRWIVDTATGQRVKLACVNWPAHMQGMLAEGLHLQPLDKITAMIAKLKFSCVRLTYSIHMFTRYANLRVEEAFENFDFKEALVGIRKYNPSLLNMTVVKAYGAVVSSLGANGVMVVSDNHISQPRWCCDNNDGNGFFGDRYFDPQEWLRGITLATQSLKDKSNVVGMSLRNEPRGPNQTVDKWFKYMSQGAKQVHQTNPNALVVLSGLSYDTDLTFLKNRTLGFNLHNKLVFEAHLYPFTNDMGSLWTSKPLNPLCASVNRGFEDRAGFLVRAQHPVPLFVSEFGIDQTGRNEGQNRFLSCFLSYLIENDFDWGLWALQGSYYYREGNANAEESFGVLNSNFSDLKSPKFVQRFQLMQTKLQDPSSKLATSMIMYHPQSGECVEMNKKYQLRMSSCKTSSRWIHEQDGAPIKLEGSKKCLKAIGDGLPPIVSQECNSKESGWRFASNAKLQLATTDEEGQTLCLQKAAPNSLQVVTKKCLCPHDDDDSQCLDDPQSQWFKLVQSNFHIK